jgi:hypothetical protein
VPSAGWRIREITDYASSPKTHGQLRYEDAQLLAWLLLIEPPRRRHTNAGPLANNL